MARGCPHFDRSWTAAGSDSGASRAFLTPVGHQSNTLVMDPGGYHFGDYWRMGLPLTVLIVLIAVPFIMFVWPL